MKHLKLPVLAIILAGFFALVLTNCTKTTPEPGLTSEAGKKTALDKPTVTCGIITQASITLTLKAGASGAPAGFSVQWMKLSDFVSLGSIWPSSDHPLLCKASFSGNANASRYNLAANEVTTVNIGEMLMDNGASTNCPDRLACGTVYVFRSFAHATSALNKSEWSANTQCITLPCGGPVGTCTYSQGYWKTHGPIPTGNNTNQWPVTSLSLGTVSYTDMELQAILNAPAAGNGLLTLAHQLIAAKLNVANGADPTDVAAAIAAADALIGGLVIPPVGSGSLAPSAVGSLVTILQNYSEGGTGPGHCD